MSTHDYDIANQAGNLFRADLNSALAAIVSQNSSASAPATTFAYQFWADTTNGWLKQRNNTNTAWITLFRLASAAPIRSPVQSKGSGYTVLEADIGNLLRATAAITFDLTAASALGDGWWCDIQGAGGAATIDPNSTEQVDGTTTTTVQDGETVRLYCDGSAFRTGRAAGGVPVGAVIDVAGTTIPTGLLAPYGQSLSTTTYAALFAQTSYTYGGSGASFNAPDCRGRTVVGKDNMGGSAASRVTVGVSGITGTTLGAAGGSEYVQTHSHTATDSGHVHSGLFWRADVSPVGTPYAYAIQMGTGTIGIGYANITVGNYGSGSSQNMPPSIILNKGIKT